MQNNPIDPIDGTRLLDELTKDMTNQQKGMITQIIQGQNILSNFSFKDAVTELDDLFDSK
ncbi:MAG: hypothetical protein KAT16_03005 [Candidatus Heimdallarchaeota archaeon]|nr:hypothetical protein [Candidatus Heimdallarchaeota archaeon]